MKVLFLIVDGKRIDSEVPGMRSLNLKEYYTPEIEDPVWELQFENNSSIYISSSSVVFGVEGDEEKGKEAEKIVSLEGGRKRRGETPPSEAS